jgi:signal transduction histidine kinase
VKDDSEETPTPEKLTTALNESAKLKSAFLKNVNHEIRTPLNAIVGHAELLMGMVPPGNQYQEIRHSAQAIVEASSRLERNFRAILDLSQLDAVTFTLAPATVKLSELIQGQLFELQPQAERKAITLVCEIEDPEITIMIDEYCLKHSLANLLDNAIKFTERGRVTVRVYRGSDGRISVEDGRISVEVEDPGIGIDPSYLSRLFEPFPQEDSRQARRYQGIGLGLALAKRYLAMNGAELSATSRKDEGSVFTIRLAAM